MSNLSDPLRIETAGNNGIKICGNWDKKPIREIHAFDFIFSELKSRQGPCHKGSIRIFKL